MRAFLAIDLAQAVRQRITDLSEKINDPACNKVEPENYHLTLKFLGDVEPARIEKLKGDLKQVEHEPFDVEVKGVGVFPKLSYIKVVWVGANGDFQPPVSQINSLTEDIKQRDHEFHSHITIARVKSRPKDKLKQLIRDNQEKEFGLQNVNKFVLKRSELKPDGPVYENLEEFKLG